MSFLDRDEPDLAKSALGHNYGRPVAVKNRYDPTNLSRLNPNIEPTIQQTRGA